MGRQVESFQPLSPFSILYDTFHRLHAHQFTKAHKHQDSGHADPFQKPVEESSGGVEVANPVWGTNWCCIGRIWSADLWNPKYASHVYKVTVAVDMLGNIILTIHALLCGPLSWGAMVGETV